MTEGTIENITALDTARSGTDIWFQVKLKERMEPFALHANWFFFHKDLKVGDRVSYIESKAKLGKDGGQGIGYEGWLLFDKLRKIGEPEMLEGGEPAL